MPEHLLSLQRKMVCCFSTRGILRLAVWELTSAGTPPKVVIDEAIELAKHFSTEQSAAFVNGVLDAVLRENRTLTQDRVQSSEVRSEVGLPNLALTSDL